MDGSKWCFGKNVLFLQKFDASKIDPLNKRFFQKLQYHEKKIKTIDPQKK